MKTAKKFIVCLLMLIISLCGITGCALTSQPYVVSIEKTSSDGVVDVYTITYSDGTTSTFEVTNGTDGEDGEKGSDGANGLNGQNGKDGKDGEDGQDGKDGEDITVDQLFEKYKENNPTATYEDFLNALSVNLTDNTQVINEALQSSAKVFTEFTVSGKTNLYSGSAVIYKIASDYTYFITNYHVVYKKNATETDKHPKKIVLYLYGSEGWAYSTKNEYPNEYAYTDYAIDCVYYGGSITADIAIIKADTDTVKAVNPNITPVTFADGYSVGETAIAIGNPEGEGISVSEGIVSVDNEDIQLQIDDQTRYYRSIRIDTAIYGGSSGGGLFNSDGKLIGITNAGNTTDQNINYAIPVQIVKSTADNIMAHTGTPKKITIGITVTPKNSKYVYDSQSGTGKIVEDILIKEVVEGSLAQTVFGLSANDIITAIKIGTTTYNLSRYFETGDIIMQMRENDKISITYERDGRSYTSPEHTIQSTDLKAVE